MDKRAPRRLQRLLAQHGAAHPTPLANLLTAEPGLADHLRAPAPWPDNATRDLDTLATTCPQHLPPSGQHLTQLCVEASRPTPRARDNAEQMITEQHRWCGRAGRCCQANLAEAARRVGLLPETAAHRLQQAEARRYASGGSPNATRSNCAAAISALRHAGLSIDKINMLRQGDVAQDGRTVNFVGETYTLDDQDAEPVALQRLVAFLNGATPRDTYATQERGPLSWTRRRALQQAAGA